jgi:hypothetical protein
VLQIRDPLLFWLRDQGWKKIQIRDEHPGSYFFEIKILKFFDAHPDPGSCQLWIRDGKSRIRDKHPRSATPTAAVNTIYTGLSYFPGLVTAVDHKREILKLCENAVIGDELFSN